MSRRRLSLVILAVLITAEIAYALVVRGSPAGAAVLFIVAAVFVVSIGGWSEPDA